MAQTDFGPAIQDQTRVPGGQWLIVALCAMAALCDGYDTQAIAFVAPRIKDLWSISPSAFGPVFSAGLAGLAAGAFAFGPIADRIGRKTVIILCVALFGICSIGTTFATDVSGLIIWRFATGLGLGGVLPNLIALTNESVTERFRNGAVMAMIGGFPLGATFAGFISAPLINAAGWKSVLYVGGAVPLLLLPLLYVFLPSSSRIQAINRTKSIDLHPPRRATEIFSPAYLVVTLLLWLAFFCNLLVLYFLVNWLPSLLSLGGSTLSTSTVCTAVLNLGGIFGAIVYARLVNRKSFAFVLAASFLLCTLCVLGMVYAGSSTSILMISAALAGAIVIGGQMAMNAITASTYPQEIRSTGVGWALGFGRIGSILGPLAGTALLDAGWKGTEPLLAAIVPLLIAAAALALFSRARQAAVGTGPLTENGRADSRIIREGATAE